MRVAIACDHGGYPLKASVIQTIQSEGHEVVDLGTDSPSPVDYPDIVQKAGMALQDGSVERAILLCGSGVGACIAANKMRGVYASVCHDTYSARQGVEHDAMNALCLGGRVIGLELVKELVKAFLSARVSSEERHQRRIGKTRSLEQGKRI